MCTAVARDVLIDVDERTRAMAILGSLRPLAIVAAPSVGGLVGAFFGWRYVFRGLAVWGAALFGAVAELNGAFRMHCAQRGGAGVFRNISAESRANFESGLTSGWSPRRRSSSASSSCCPRRGPLPRLRGPSTASASFDGASRRAAGGAAAGDPARKSKSGRIRPTAAFLCRGDVVDNSAGSRRRRGDVADIPRGRGGAAATTRIFRGVAVPSIRDPQAATSAPPPPRSRF